MADGGINKASEFNTDVVVPSEEKHWHEFKGGSQTYGNKQSNPLVEKDVRVLGPSKSPEVKKVTEGAAVVIPTPQEMANYLDALLDHDHPYDDEYATVCNCNCNCNCNCTRGAL